MSNLLEKEERRHHKHPTQPADDGHFKSRCLTLVGGERICHLWNTHAEELLEILQASGPLLDHVACLRQRLAASCIASSYVLLASTLPRSLTHLLGLA
jgi:hypothetical protein